MKVINLTDFPSPALEKYGMVNQSISVGGSLLEPGQTVAVSLEMEAAVRAELEHFLAIGAVAIDTPPPDYRQAPPTTPNSPGASYRTPFGAPPPPPPEPVAAPSAGPGNSPPAPDTTVSESITEPRKSRKKE